MTSVNPTSTATLQHMVRRVVAELGQSLDLSISPTISVDRVSQSNMVHAIHDAALNAGIVVRSTAKLSAADLTEVVGQGYPVVLLPTAGGDIMLLKSFAHRRFDIRLIGQSSAAKKISLRSLNRWIRKHSPLDYLVAKRELECDSLSSFGTGSTHDAHEGNGHSSSHGHGHEHPEPLRRFVALLDLDRRDIWMLTLFALVGGVLSLGTPLAIEWLVNVVSWGVYVQPLIVLAGVLLVCLGLAGVMKVLQTVVVEMIQRRQFVRIVGDLSHRFPRADAASLVGHHRREYANRVFDIMTIQKATAVLLLDGVSIVLTTVLGLLLLAFYHPFLLGFDVVLVIAMISITWLLGFGGIRTAIDESITKYRVVYWLQDILDSPTAFKANGGESLAIARANQLTSDYIRARRSQFRVVLRQVAFAIGLQVIASTTLLGLGGYLVISGQLTLGQLVASELVVTLVVSAFAKAGKSLEKFYDLMAGMDKVGHLLDIPVDPRSDLDPASMADQPLHWDALNFHLPTVSLAMPGGQIDPGSSVAIGGDATLRSLLAESIAGIRIPTAGHVRMGSQMTSEIAATGNGGVLALAAETEVFHASLRNNIDLGRVGVNQTDVRNAIEIAGLGEVLLDLEDGLQTAMESNGYPLTTQQSAQLMIARAIAGRPRCLIIDGVLDRLSRNLAHDILGRLLADAGPQTLILVTGHAELANRLAKQINAPEMALSEITAKQPNAPEKPQ